MAITPERKAELEALIAAHKAKQASVISPKPVGLSNERMIELDALIKKQKIESLPLAGGGENLGQTVLERGESFIQKETTRLGSIADAAKGVFTGKIPVNQVGNIIAGQVGLVANDLIGELVTGIGSFWFKQQPKERQDAINSGIQSVAEAGIPGTEITVKDSVAKLVETYDAWKKRFPSDAVQAESLAGILSLVPLAGISEAIASASRRIAAETILATGGTAKYIPPAFGGKVVEGAVAQGAAKAAETGKGVVGEIISSADRTIRAIPGRIEANRAALEASRKVLESLSLPEQEALTNGVSRRDVSLYRELSSAEKAVARAMISHAEQFDVNRAAQDPAEIAGHEVTRRLDPIYEVAEQQGVKLGELVSLFPNVRVSNSIVPSVFNALRTVPGLRGIVVKPDGTLDFTRTVLARKLSSAERLTVSNAFNDIFGMDAEQLHLYRQELFEVLDGKGKAGLILNGVEPMALNAIRQGISDVLDATVPGYKPLNQQNAELLGLRSEYQKLFKGLENAAEDVRDARGAILMRRLTNNSPSAQNLADLFQRTESVLSKYGFTFDTKLHNIQDVLNAITRYFDITKDTGAAGQIRVGVEDIKTSLTGAIMGKAQEFAGTTKDVTRNSFKKLFDELLEGGEKGDNKPNTPNNPVDNNEGGGEFDNIKESVPQTKVEQSTVTEKATTKPAKKKVPTKKVTKKAVDNPASPLLSEAKKYKTADEFVKSLNLTKQSKPNTELSSIQRQIDIKEFGNDGKILLAESESGVKTNKAAVSAWEQRITDGERPIVYVGGTFMRVVDGNNRLAAYKNLGFKEVPTVFESQLLDIYKKAHGEKPSLGINSVDSINDNAAIPHGAAFIPEKAKQVQLGTSDGHTFNADGSDYDGDHAIATLHSVTLEKGADPSDVINSLYNEYGDVLNKHKDVLKLGVFPMGEGRVSIDMNIATDNRMVAEKIARDNNQHSYWDPKLWNPKEKKEGNIFKTGGTGVQKFSRDDIQNAIRAVRKFNADNENIKTLSNKYNKSRGLNKTKNTITFSLDKEKSAKIADAFDAMSDNPSDPKTLAAYTQLAKETKKQFQFLEDNGYTMEPWTGEGEPYKGTDGMTKSSEMTRDLAENKHLFFFKTDEGFGSGVSLSHPLLKDSGIVVNGYKMKFNDLFRAVHDVFGHGKIGNQFGALGEENAWLAHRQMYSDLASKALTTETRGQNSWVNFGKHLEGKGLKPADRPYAEQKTNILPDEFLK